MEINADFTQRVAVNSASLEWKSSPIQGVERRMLDRIGGEIARATSIVRYAPRSKFSAHIHTGGEEFIVLDGIFQDEHGDYPTGWYLRNPPTSEHTPGSDDGCTIFVKLWQFDPDDRKYVKIDMNAATLSPDSSRPGVASSILFEDARELVQVEQWDADTSVTIDAPFGAEILVLDGNLTEGADVLGLHDWLRVPKDSTLSAKTGPDGARVWVKVHRVGPVMATLPTG